MTSFSTDVPKMSPHLSIFVLVEYLKNAMPSVCGNYSASAGQE